MTFVISALVGRLQSTDRGTYSRSATAGCIFALTAGDGWFSRCGQDRLNQPLGPGVRPTSSFDLHRYSMSSLPYLSLGDSLSGILWSGVRCGRTEL